MDNKSYSKGISWFDDCRIPFVDDKDKGSVLDPITGIKGYKHTAGAMTGGIPRMDSGNPIGRYPANLLVCDDMLNDGNIIQYNKNRTDNGTYLGGHRKEYVGTDDNDVVKQIKGQFFNDKGSNSRYYDIDKWFDNIISE
jgi:hypothetical protein